MEIPYIRSHMPSIWRLIKMLFSVLSLGRRHRKSMEHLRSLMGKQRGIAAVLDAYRLGDYETGLRASAALQSADEASYYFFHGSMLTQLGRFQEAERDLRKCASLPQDGPLTAIAYSSLGQLLVESERYDEAMKCFETSLRHDPQRGASDRDIACAWLRRGKAAEALKSARAAVEKERGSTLPAEAGDLNLREALATLAWAVASTSHDRGEVDHLAAEAAPPERTCAPASCAEVHVNLGKAYAALGDAHTCERHFAEAARVDPNGLWGRAANACAASR
jgi:tetratricopeptide (TPR) repeat protein